MKARQTKRLRKPGQPAGKAAMRAYIHSFCGIFKTRPGEKSMLQEHLEERQAARARENA